MVSYMYSNSWPFNWLSLSTPKTHWQVHTEDNIECMAEIKLLVSGNRPLAWFFVYFSKRLIWESIGLLVAWLFSLNLSRLHHCFSKLGSLVIDNCVTASANVYQTNLNPSQLVVFMCYLVKFRLCFMCVEGLIRYVR